MLVSVAFGLRRCVSWATWAAYPTVLRCLTPPPPPPSCPSGSPSRNPQGAPPPPPAFGPLKFFNNVGCPPLGQQEADQGF